MIGNVWELCRDHYAAYSDVSCTTPETAFAGTPADRPSDSRVSRGGSYIYGAADARSARRSSTTTTGRSVYNGVRPARIVSAE